MHYFFFYFFINCYKFAFVCLLVYVSRVCGSSYFLVCLASCLHDFYMSAFRLPCSSCFCQCSHLLNLCNLYNYSCSRSWILHAWLYEPAEETVCNSTFKFIIPSKSSGTCARASKTASAARCWALREGTAKASPTVTAHGKLKKKLSSPWHSSYENWNRRTRIGRNYLPIGWMCFHHVNQSFDAHSLSKHIQSTSTSTVLSKPRSLTKAWRQY